MVTAMPDLDINASPLYAFLMEHTAHMTPASCPVQGSAAEDQNKVIEDIMKQAAKMAEEQAAQEAAEKQSASAQSQPDSQQVPTHDLWCHGCLPATSSFAIGHRNWTSLVSCMHCLLVSSLPWCASQVL